MAPDHQPVIGRCPYCETPIPDRNTLISYELSDGGAAVYAGCPECEVPVHPDDPEPA